MSEFNEPHPIMDRFVDSSEISARVHELRRVRNIRSAAHLAAISQLRAEGHRAANLFRDFHVGTTENGTEALRQELGRSQTVLARWALMRAHPEFLTVDLARVENRGDWDAPAEVEADLAALAQSLRDTGDGGEFIRRTESAAKRRIAVDPTLVSANGLIAVRRKRLMLMTAPRQVRFVDRRRVSVGPSPEFEALSHIEIDKVSEFVLDLTMVRRMNAKAAREIEEAAADGDAPGEITNHGRVAPRMIEAAIDVRHEMLTPAVTTYFADRKYTKIHKIESADQPDIELVDA